MNKLAPLAALALAACQGAPVGNGAANAVAVVQQRRGEPVWLHATDKLEVKGTYYRADHPKAMILLFHQAGSSKDEYATIAPKLVEAGYSALAIDQRSGGAMFGPNETIKQMPRDWPDSMEDAEQDMAGALRWARPKRLPIILWGSSYSAALAIPLADDYPDDVEAVLSFSPGEYFTDKDRVGRAAASLKVPIFITSADTPDEEVTAKAIADKVPDHLATLYVPGRGGVHGSSTLIESRDPNGAKANWAAVTAFLNGLTPAPAKPAGNAAK